jgi:ketosteroid isomerase-like protein
MASEPQQGRNGSESAKPMARAAIVEMFNRRIEAFDSLDAAAVAADYTDDCVIESTYAGLHVGRAAAEEVIRRWFDTFQDLKVRTRDVIFDAETNRIAHVVDVEGTDLAGFLGVAPTGRPYEGSRSAGSNGSTTYIGCYFVSQTSGVLRRTCLESTERYCDKRSANMNSTLLPRFSERYCRNADIKGSALN